VSFRFHTLGIVHAGLDLPFFRILEKAEILYHAGRFRLAWDEVRATLNRFDEINFENEKALAGCERPFRLDSGDLLASYVRDRLYDDEVKRPVSTSPMSL
jgi:hypothetical protein